MKINITTSKTKEIELTNKQVKEVAIKYLENSILKGNYINDKGHLEYWTSYPHGSGMTYDKGPASELQKKAYALLKELRNEDN